MSTTKFCTLEDVKSELNIGVTHTADDASLNYHIVKATAHIRSVTRRNWEYGTYTKLFNTIDVNTAIRPDRSMAKFTLDERPLQSITSVIYHSGGKFSTTDPLSTDLYTVDLNSNSFIMYPSRMHALAGSLQVTYIAGYAVDVTDTDLLLVDGSLSACCAIQAASTFRRAMNQASGTTKKTGKSSEYSMASNGLVSEANSYLKGKTLLLMGS